MAFSWDKCIERAKKQKDRQEKQKANHNKDFISKLGKMKIRGLRE